MRLRTDATAELSLADILARSKLGIAIAAMIRMNGIATTPRYPRTRPAMARPWPVKRPALFLISDRERWPRMIATTESGKILMIPQIKLPIALQLVCGWPTDGGGEPGNGCSVVGC